MLLATIISPLIHVLFPPNQPPKRIIFVSFFIITISKMVYFRFAIPDIQYNLLSFCYPWIQLNPLYFKKVNFGSLLMISGVLSGCSGVFYWVFAPMENPENICPLSLRTSKKTDLFYFTLLQIGKQPGEDLIFIFQVSLVDAWHLSMEVNQDRSESESVILLDVSIRTFHQFNLLLFQLIVDIFQLKKN